MKFQFGFKTVAALAVLVALLATGYRRHLAYQALDIVQTKAKFVRPVPQTTGWVRIFDGDIWRIHHLSFHGSPGITDEEVRQVRHLTSLRRLSLHHAAITDASAPVLARLTNLEALSLQRTQITDRTIAQLTHLTRLQSLSLRETKITDEALKVIGRLPMLKELLLDRTEVTPAGLVHLQDLPNLERLTLRQNHLRLVAVEQKTDRAGILSLANHAKLRELDLSNWELAESDLTFLGYLPQLQSLSISCNATSFPAEFWNQLPRLEKIWIRNNVPCHVHCEDHASLAHVAIFPGLNDNSDVELPSLVLRNIPKLNSWSDSGRRWSKIECSYLPSLPDVIAQGESITLDHLEAHNITLYGFRTLSLSDLPKVVECNASPAVLTRDIVQELSQLSQLATLYFAQKSEHHSADTSQADLFSPLRGIATLKSLRLSDFTLTEEEMQVFAGCSIEMLNVSSCRVTEPAARVLLDMPSLKLVQLPESVPLDIKNQLKERGVQMAPPSGFYMHDGRHGWFDTDFDPSAPTLQIIVK